MNTVIALFLALLLLLPLSNANFIVEIEAEYGFSTNAEKHYRSGAANGLAVFLKQEGQIALFFQVTSEETCLMQVHDILYSNDGSSNAFILHLNNKSIGEAVNNASNNNTYLLNQFISTGQAGEEVIIREGLYNLTITVETADEFGVEIDSVSVYMMHCSNITTNVSVVYNG
uniref:TNF family profile domain-containing protein n=1 Tax=Amphimedon queenslandica TaxID=400682 RepID=A0A1X7UBG8_AMPQE